MFPSFLDPDGLFRVKRLYSEIINGDHSAEAGIIFKSWYYSLATGAIIGSTVGVKPIYDDFKVRFNEMQFQGKSAYARKLLDCTVVSCGRNGIRMAWRASLLVTLFTASACTLAVYHNDVRFSDLIFASSISGAFYFFHRGPKAMFAGSILSGLAGIPIAGLGKLTLWTSGFSYSEFSDRARDYFDAPAIARKKSQQKKEEHFKNLSTMLRDDFKNYIYHQRRVDRLEKMGIVDDSFKQLKPAKGINPKEFEKGNN